MGDKRFDRHLARVASARDRAAEIASMDDDEIVQALAAASKGAQGDVAYLANVLGTEALNRMHRTRVAEAKYRSIFMSVQDAIVVADTKRRIVDANPSFEALLAYRADDIRGQTTRLLYENDDAYAEVGRLLRAHLHAGKPFTRLVRMRRKSGHVFLAELSAVDVRDAQGALVGYMAFVRDVTEHERLAEEARRWAETATKKVHDAQRFVEEHSLRTGEGASAPDVPAAREAAEAVEAAERAALRAAED